MDAHSLSCSICNRRPQFSDVSHLLTHISSKAHLASHFKLQVQSKHSSQALEDLTQYDRWCKENDIARLLSDRMASSAKSNRRRRSNRSLGTETGRLFDVSLFVLLNLVSTILTTWQIFPLNHRSTSRETISTLAFPTCNP